MKRTILTVLALLPLLAFGQVKKKPTPKPTEIQIMKSNALKWFKDVYVESTFKDPYSYKLLKADIYPQTNKEAVEKIISDLDLFFYKVDTTEIFSDYSKKKLEYKNVLSRLKSYPDTYKQSDVDRVKKELDLTIFNHENKVEEIKKAKDLLKNMDTVMASKVHHYTIYVDCYSNNSYGNQVLGRFVFSYGKDGVVEEPRQLNKD